MQYNPGDGNTLAYNADNLPIEISAGGVTADFYYGADEARFRQQKSKRQRCKRHRLEG